MNRGFGLHRVEEHNLEEKKKKADAGKASTLPKGDLIGQRGLLGCFVFLIIGSCSM